jgi:hypothetical protein
VRGIVEGARRRMLDGAPSVLEGIKARELRAAVLEDPGRGSLLILKAIRSAQFDAALAGLRQGLLYGFGLSCGLIGALLWLVLR